MKLVLATLLSSLIAAPVFAQHGNYNHNHRHQPKPHYHHHRNNQWVAPALIGAIGTAIVVDQYNRSRQVVVEQPQIVIAPNPPMLVQQPNIIVHQQPNVSLTCSSWKEIMDSTGRIYRERICTEISN